MEILIAILFIAVLLLWSRTSDATHRVSEVDEALGAVEAALEDRLAATEAEIRHLRASLSANWEAGTALAAPPVETVTPTEQPTPALASAPPVAPVPPPPSPSDFVPPPPPRKDLQTAAAAAQWARPKPLAAAPAGPGLMHQMLVKVGFAPPDEGQGWSFATIQAWLEGRLLAVVGGIALVLGAVFFLSLAFSRGWITEPMRVLIALGAGVGLMILGELSFTRLRGILGHVLVAIGLAVVSLALLAATRLYGLVPVEAGLAGAFVAAVAAATIAVRHDSQLVAGFGLIAVLAAPPVLGARPETVTLLFVAATLVGTTGVALFRTWAWLPPLAFILAAPQLASYVTGAPGAVGLVAVMGFWLVNIVASGGEETRHRTDQLRTTTVTLLLANAAFTLWAGFTVLAGDLEQWHGTFASGLGAVHLALGLFFLARYGDGHPFGLVVAATGVAALTMAVPVQFGGPTVPIAWAAEAVALAWVAVLRRHPYSAAVSVLLGVMALAHLVGFEYRITALADGIARDVPFIGPEGLTFAFMIAALAVAGVLVPIAWVRAGLAAVGWFVAIYVFPFELSGTALVAGWAALATAGLVLHVRVVMPRIGADFRDERVSTLAIHGPLVGPISALVESASGAVRPAFMAAAVLAALGMFAHLITFEYPPAILGSGIVRAIPFVGAEGLAFAIVLAALGVAGALIPVAWFRVGIAALAGLVALWVFPFELSGPALVWAWAALSAAAFALEALVIEPRVGPAFAGLTVLLGVRPALRPAVRAVGAVVGVAVLAHLVAFDFPLAELGGRVLSAIPYFRQESLSLLGAIAALAVVGLVMGARWVRLGMVGIGLALLVYSVTFEVAQPRVAVAWSLLALASVAVVRRGALVDLLPRTQKPLLELVAERLPFGAAGLAFIFLGVQSLSLATVPGFARQVTGIGALEGIAFVDDRTYVLAVLATAALIAGWIWGGLMPLLRGGIAGALVVAWLLPFEVRPGYAVAGWSALALAGLWLARIVPPGRDLLGGVSLVVLAMSGATALTIVAPPSRLVVDASSTVLGWWPVTDATVALGAIAIATGLGAYLPKAERLRLPGLAVSGVVAVYLLSVGVVDAFQLQVGTRAVDVLQWEAQVGLSGLWAIVGSAGFAAGIMAGRPPVRLFGLALLGLATVKVFVLDLVGLPVEQRVLSLVVLGVLLLISSAVYARLQHPDEPIGPSAPKHV